ncbi:MAG: leucine-rich repeat protein [Clostridia bacterium]|nr:leucine-rich repeat protein [Clostridia bacterium]
MKKHRTIKISVAFLCIIAAISATYIASAEVYSDTKGANSWILDTDTGVLTISGTDMTSDYIGYQFAPHSEYTLLRDYVTRVEISKGIPAISGLNYPNMKTATIPDSVTEIGHGTFSGCTSLTEIVIPNSVTILGENDTYYGSVFYDCVNLKNVTLSNQLTSIPSKTFSGCESLTEITIPDSVIRIDHDAFRDCTSLSKVSLPNSIKSIGHTAFMKCESLTEIKIPSLVSTIGYNTFAYCTSLESITIPAKVTEIGENAFNECYNLSTVNYEGTPEQWNKIKIMSGNSAITSATINYNYYESSEEQAVTFEGHDTNKNEDKNNRVHSETNSNGFIIISVTAIVSVAAIVIVIIIKRK